MAPGNAGSTPRPCVLVAAGRAEWEPAVLSSLTAARMVVLRRCVDVVDLVATASASTSDAAVVAADLDGIDTDSLRRLRAAGVEVVAVGGPERERDRLTRLSVPTVADPAGVVDAVQAQVSARSRPRTARARTPGPAASPDAGADAVAPAGTVIAVWGAAGAPGRSTVAAALAAERARVRRVVLCDIDPYAGSLAQSLGVLDETSGLLAVARAAGEGALDDDALRSCLRSVGPGLDLLTGLPRAERWVEVRPGVVQTAAGLASATADVVLDCGFGIDDPDDPTGGGPGRVNAEALGLADRVVVVGSAEPVALARLVRALVALSEAVPGAGQVSVVVNRMRASLGWSTGDITAMVAEVAPGAPVAFWPYERAALDRASLRGVALPELGETPLRDCARALGGQVFDQVPAASSGAEQ